MGINRLIAAFDRGRVFCNLQKKKYRRLIQTSIIHEKKQGHLTSTPLSSLLHRDDHFTTLTVCVRLNLAHSKLMIIPETASMWS